MKIFRIHIAIIVVLMLTESGFGFQGADRRTAYVPYSQRILELTNDLENVRGPGRNTVLLSLAEKHFEQAEFYSLMTYSAAAIGELYFTIMEENEIDAGRAAALYRGIGLFELGRFTESEKVLEEFLNRGNNLPENLQTDGRAWLGAARYAGGDTRGAEQQWQSIPGRERETCSVVAYVWGRVGYNVDALQELCSTAGSADAKDVMPVIRAMVAAGWYDLLPGLLMKHTFTASYVEHAGSEKELRYFNPSEIRTLSHAHYALAAHYAGLSDNEKYSRFYTGVMNFKTGRDGKVIDTLVGIDDLRSAVYLAAAYYRNGQKEIAREVFDYLERTGSEDVLAELYMQYAAIGVGEKEAETAAFFKKQTRSGEQGSRRNVPQDLYRQLGLMYLYNKDYDNALESLGVAFRTERRDDLRANDPGFMILYGTSIVLSKNFISLSEAIDMFSTVMRAYPPAIALVETTALIDVVTNIGREGRVIYRR